MDGGWQPLRLELDRWRDEGRTAPLWLRDDDATAPSDALDGLVGLTGRHGVPLVLAVIPSTAAANLAAHLASAAHVHPAVHGWSHANHAPPGEKKQELGPHRPLEALEADCARGLERLRHLLVLRLTPMLVPPWNRIAPALISRLPALGFRFLSAFGRQAPETAGLKTVNTHVDLVDFRRTRELRGRSELIRSLATELAHARATGGGPVGVLGHHRVSAGPAFGFLHDLFTFTRDHGAARWLGPDDFAAQTP